MGNRLSKIYTRTGDGGTTGLGDGSRTDKDGARVIAFGTVDELNAAIGMMAVHPMPQPIAAILFEVQHHLFDLGGELCVPGYDAVEAGQGDWLEAKLDAYNAELPPLKDFILPGGGPAAAACHFARTVCRRAERCVHTLQRSEPVNPHGLAYLNRLSDLLFVLGRVLARYEGGAEVVWQRNRSPS
ncbi:MAG: ATP:cob(I)alamin adenosyltransferase [Proteobacteria bacterium SW_6_67_9]|nr:MAG: ATP:cob(I)alamin adenosyltransferase [Proteobacteria bacterium SW_6_67_9]